MSDTKPCFSCSSHPKAANVAALLCSLKHPVQDPHNQNEKEQDKGSPRLRTLEILKKPEKELFTKTKNQIAKMQLRIQHLYFSLNPISFPSNK